MWYLYSLLFCHFFGILLTIKIVNQAECNRTPLTNHQFKDLELAMVIAMSLPLLNVIWSINTVYKWIFDPYRFEDETDGLIDHIRRSAP